MDVTRSVCLAHMGARETLNRYLASKISVCVHISAVIRPNTGEFSDPGLGRQWVIRSGLARPTVTFIAGEITPVRARERKRDISYHEVQ